MKVMKKISAILLSLCLLVPCFSMVVAAADGRISFTDPSTAVGEYVEVRCVLRSTSGNMGAVKVTLSYDESYLKFESGDSIEVGGAGELICAGTATSAEASFVAKFQALQEGTTKVEITSSEVSDANSATLTLDHGNSTITIAEGDPSKIEETDTESESESTAVAEDVQVDVDGVSYTLTDEFADADIPNGYARAQRTIEGVERQVVENETGMVCLVYMIDAEGSGEFFLYNEENNSYSPYAEIAISDVASIIVLNDTSQVSLPAQYKEAKLSLNEKEFPVWQDTENEGLYILHAMNNEGEAGYYQYDATEGTYQKMEFDVEENAAEESAVTTSSIVDKVLGFVEGHLLLVLLAVAVCAVLGLLILIILAVKLHNRNAELDELYDQYGIGEEAKEVVEEKPAKKEKKNKKKRQKEADFEEADFEEQTSKKQVLKKQALRKQILKKQALKKQISKKQTLKKQILKKQVLKKQVLKKQVLKRWRSKNNSKNLK